MIRTETIVINGREYIRTYSDANRYIIASNPAGSYVEALDYANANRVYVEGDLIDDENEVSSDEALDILLGGAE